MPSLQYHTSTRPAPSGVPSLEKPRAIQLLEKGTQLLASGAVRPPTLHVGPSAEPDAAHHKLHLKPHVLPGSCVCHRWSASEVTTGDCVYATASSTSRADQHVGPTANKPSVPTRCRRCGCCFRCRPRLVSCLRRVSRSPCACRCDGLVKLSSNCTVT